MSRISRPHFHPQGGSWIFTWHGPLRHQAASSPNQRQGAAAMLDWMLWLIEIVQVVEPSPSMPSILAPESPSAPSRMHRCRMRCTTSPPSTSPPCRCFWSTRLHKRRIRSSGFISSRSAGELPMPPIALDIRAAMVSSLISNRFYMVRVNFLGVSSCESSTNRL